MKLLLDTHIFLWLITGDKSLNKELKRYLDNPGNELFLSVASVWECVIKFQLGKLDLPEPPETYLPRKRKEFLIKSLAIDEESTFYLRELALLHKDPFDRLLICQSLHYDLTMVTKDEAILKYPNITLFEFKKEDE